MCWWEWLVRVWCLDGYELVLLDAFLISSLMWHQSLCHCFILLCTTVNNDRLSHSPSNRNPWALAANPYLLNSSLFCIDIKIWNRSKVLVRLWWLPGVRIMQFTVRRNLLLTLNYQIFPPLRKTLPGNIDHHHQLCLPPYLAN